MSDTYFEALARCENGETAVSVNGEKKKVFLIGDSIRQGYAPFVKKNLTNQFDVVYPEENCRNTQFVITSLRTWANMFEKREDVVAITFNCGHWDVAHWNQEEESLTAPQEYGNNIRRIIKQLRKFFPAASILFITTSPMAPGDTSRHFNPRSNQEIAAYNAIATIACQEEGVAILDLYALMEDWGVEKYQDYAHPTPASNQVLGDAVTSAILEVLT